jgi:hypothetical protein
VTLVIDHVHVPCDRPDLCSMADRCHHAKEWRKFCYSQEWEHAEPDPCENCLKLEAKNAKLKLLLAQSHRLRSTFGGASR